MKLQIFILAVGVAVSAGAVTAELNRVPSGNPVTQITSTLVSASPSSPSSPSSPKRSDTSTPISVPQTAPAQPITKVSTVLLYSAKPSITGISSGENDD